MVQVVEPIAEVLAQLRRRLHGTLPHHVAFDPDVRSIGVGVRAMAGWLAERARSRR